MHVRPVVSCGLHYKGMESWSGCVISSKLIWSEGTEVSLDSLVSDTRKISMKDVLHLLSADTNPICPHYDTLSSYGLDSVFKINTDGN